MNNKVRQIAKFILCTGIVISAPIILASAANFTTVEVEKHLEIALCEKAAVLDKVSTVCR
jgi:hypothetical protein